jgi:hypothetical protein
MSRALITLGILIFLAPAEFKERASDLRRRSTDISERFWRKYDRTANRIIDKLEDRGVFRTKDYSTNKS